MYFSPDHKNNVQNILNDINDRYNLIYKWEDVEIQNWMDNWKDSFKPIQIEGKVIVIPDWDQNNYNVEHVIKICPAMAFGTGHHESTQLVMEQMIKMNIKKYSSLLDLGTGSGILSILAKKMGIKKITAIDIDDLCEENFYQNCKLSNVGDIDFHILDVHEYADYDYDAILANIDKNNIVKILDKYQRSKTKAIMILAGLLDRDLDDIKSCMYNCDIQSLNQKGEWISLVVKNKVFNNDK